MQAVPTSAGEHHLPELLTLQKIAEGTASSTGTAFFKALVRNLSEAIGIHGAWVTELLEEHNRLRAMAFWVNGAFVDHYEYDISGTPCEPVLGCQGVFHVPEKVIELFPKDPDLPPLDAVSYMGVALKDTDGTILGHLAVLDNKPMKQRPRIITIFKIFAARAAAELQRIRATQKTEESEQRLYRLVNGTNDAILEFNNDLLITQANKAALSLFGLNDAALPATSVKALFTGEGFSKFAHALYHVKQADDSIPYHWIQGYVSCNTLTGKIFPAEATLSAYHALQEDYYILIIRNVQHKLEAEETIKNLSLETELLREEINGLVYSGEITGNCPGIRKALKAVQQVAPLPTTVLITGETGTGKELFARAIHHAGNRSKKPLIKLNCAALPANLVESELFGHEKGAFTGATGKREGRFALADGGTLFLDEMGELPLELQAKLLRVLQEGEFEPIGSNTTKKVDVRIIAATNRNLLQDVQDGKFREDLYYRLHVFPIHIPPLRERGNDIIQLADFFLRKFAAQLHKPLHPLTPAQEQQLLAYQWPGNVRELQNVMERAVITSETGQLQLQLTPHQQNNQTVAEDKVRILTAAELKAIETANIRRALDASGWRIAGAGGAAALLGIPSTTLTSRIKALGISR